MIKADRPSWLTPKLLSSLSFVNLVSVLIGLAGCAVTHMDKPPQEPKTEINKGLDQCRTHYGPSAEAIVISESEYQCRVLIEDQSMGLSKLYNDWKHAMADARNLGAPKKKLTEISLDWQTLVKRYSEKMCPKNLTADPIPLNNKIVCYSDVLSKNVLVISPHGGD